MATVTKDFKIKHGLIVEGTNATVDGSDIITADSITAGNGEGGNENVTVSYDAEAKKVTFEAPPEYTDEDVKAVLTGSSQTNISITEVEGVLTIAAENGVDDATTADLAEDPEATVDSGTMYFTNARARAALSGGTGIDYDDESGEIAVDTTEIATKTYVDEVAQGIIAKPAVEAATTTNLSGTYSNGTSGVDATLTLAASATLDIDGWTTWEEGYGVLVKDQTNAFENGRYFIDQVGDAETAWILKRCIYCDESDEIAGSYFFVKHGSINASTGWVATVENPETFTIGTDDITIIQFSGAGTYSGGTGIDVNGTEISIDFTEFDSDEIDEGDTNLYYTDQRVKDVLTGSTQTNISITEVEGDLVITAENGVDDSTTADLAEDPEGSGTSGTWYFTDQRAVDALEAVVPDFEAVEINSIAKQIAATATLTTAEVVGTVYSFAYADYRTAKFLVKMAAGSHTEVVEVLLTLDTSNNIAITEYAIVGTNGTMGVVSASVSGSDVLLTVNPNNNNTTVKVYGTLLV